MSDGEPSDMIVQFIRKNGAIYTDEQLAKMIQHRYHVKLSLCKISRIRLSLGIRKLPFHLRPHYARLRQKAKNYNKETIIEVCNAILAFSANQVSNTIYIHARRLQQFGITKGKASYVFAYLHQAGIASMHSKSIGKKIWKIDVDLLKKEVEKLENEKNNNKIKIQ
ncbi:MAG: hypothetical protein J7K47_03590 [Thermoplasmata archaeon]|nr:hypothetical protein [Thermoplasmata archaeon]